MTRVFNKTSVKSKRRMLRRNMPLAEVLLWSRLKGKNLAGFKFRRQYSVGSYIIDFYCPEVRLGIEVDGDSHFSGGAEKMDLLRGEAIESYGIRLLRFTNNDVYENVEAVLEKIAECLLKATSPCPSL